MVNEKIRKALDNYIEDTGRDDEINLFDNHAYDNSIVGITTDNRIVYDFEKMVREFAEEEECDELEAIEWIEVNTLPSLCIDRSPIIINITKEELLEKYED